MLFMRETKCSLDNIQEISSKIWLGSLGIATNARGTVGRLVILWHPKGLHLNNFRASRFFINTDFQVYNSEVRWTLTNVYGPSIIAQKLAFVSLLDKEAHEMENHLWIVGGDFNMNTSLKEKKGGRRTLEATNISFKDFI